MRRLVQSTLAAAAMVVCVCAIPRPAAAGPEPYPISLNDRPLLLSRGWMALDTRVSVTPREAGSTLGLLHLTARFAVRRWFEMEFTIPFTIAPRFRYEGPAAGASIVLAQRARFEAAFRLNVAALGFWPTPGLGALVRQGPSALLRATPWLRFDASIFALHQLNEQPKIGVDVPIAATFAIGNRLSISASTGARTRDVRDVRALAVPLMATATYVVAWKGKPLLDLGAFVGRPSLVIVPRESYGLITAGLAVTVQGAP